MEDVLPVWLQVLPCQVQVGYVGDPHQIQLVDKGLEELAVRHDAAVQALVALGDPTRLQLYS